jgi:hypothetical protein
MPSSYKRSVRDACAALGIRSKLTLLISLILIVLGNDIP